MDGTIVEAIRNITGLPGLPRMNTGVAGKVITVAVIEDPPYISIKRHPNGNINRIEGYLADIWIILESQLKFRTVFQDVESGLIGLNNNGTWNGMMGHLQNQKADVGLLNFGITLERSKIVEFSAAVDYDDSKLLQYSSTGIKEEIDWFIFTTTLSWDVWCCVGAIWIATSLVLAYINSRYSDVSYIHYLFMLFGTLTCQGSEVEPKGYKGRLIFITFLATCVIVYESYTALLTTHFTTTTQENMKNLKEILNSGYKVSVINGSLQHQGILEGGSDEYDKIKNMLRSNPKLLVRDYEKGVQSTYDERTLFLYFSNVLQTKLSNCSFTIRAPSVLAGYHHLIFRKGFPYKEDLDVQIIKMTTGGITNKLALKWLTAHAACSQFSDDVPSLSFKKTFFAFLIAIGGVGVSGLILILEIGFASIRGTQMKTDASNWFMMNKTAVKPFNDNITKRKQLQSRGFTY